MDVLEIKVEDDIKQQLTPSTVKMEFVEIKEELNETFLEEHETWDGSEVNLNPKVEITIEETPLVVPKEVADCTLPDMVNSPFVVIQPEGEGETSAVPHNTVSADSKVQLSLNVKSSSLSGCKIPSVNQYSTDIIKKIMCRKRETSALQIMEPQVKKLESNKINKPLLQNEMYNSTEQTLKCDTIQHNTGDSGHKCFSTSSTLNTLIGTHTGNKLYTCVICHKCYNRQSNLKRHIRTHTGSKPYTCDKCHKCFSDLSNLKTHTHIHTVGKPYICDTCHRYFSWLSSLKRHIKTHRK